MTTALDKQFESNRRLSFFITICRVTTDLGYRFTPIMLRIAEMPLLRLISELNAADSLL